MEEKNNTVEDKITIELEAINTITKELNERAQRILLRTNNLLSHRQKDQLASLNVWRELFDCFPSDG